MTEVSVRELKSNLSEYLRRAEAGENIVVTRRGKRVVSLTAENGRRDWTREQRLADMEARGLISRGKPGKFPLPDKRIKLRGEGPTMSEMIIRDRR